MSIETLMKEIKLLVTEKKIVTRDDSKLEAHFGLFEQTQFWWKDEKKGFRNWILLKK